MSALLLALPQLVGTTFNVLPTHPSSFEAALHTAIAQWAHPVVGVPGPYNK